MNHNGRLENEIVELGILDLKFKQMAALPFL